MHCSRIVKRWTEKYTGREIVKTADGSIWEPFDRPVYVDKVRFGEEKDGRVCECPNGEEAREQ